MNKGAVFAYSEAEKVGEIRLGLLRVHSDTEYATVCVS